MSKKRIFEDIVSSLEVAIAYEKGEPVGGVRRHTISIQPLPEYDGDAVRKLRIRLRLSQRTFAYAFGVSIKTVEAWESGKNTPAGPAQRLLGLFDKDTSLLERSGIVSMKE